LVKEINMNPMTFDPWIRKNPGPFRVGDRVAFRFVVSDVEGTIVEDRGNLGHEGRRLYGIEFRMDDVSDAMYTEMDAESLKLVAPAGTATPTGQAR